MLDSGISTLPSVEQQRAEFWLLPLEALNAAEWEALCDGCGLCCLNKLQDEDTDEVFFTNVACNGLDLQTCRCQYYAQRQQKVPDCLCIRNESAAHPQMFNYLPATCSYRLRHLQQPLPQWHPLLTGQPIRSAQVMGQQGVINEKALKKTLHEHIISWVKTG